MGGTGPPRQGPSRLRLTAGAKTIGPPGLFPRPTRSSGETCAPSRNTTFPPLRHLALSRAWAALGTGVALAQKPPGFQQPAPVPPPRMPTTKPPALGAPQQPRQLPQQPPPPRWSRRRRPPPRRRAESHRALRRRPRLRSWRRPPRQPQPPAVAPAPTPPPVATPAPLPQPVPANEPPGITALRALLVGAQLNYAAAETLDPATGRARMTGVGCRSPPAAHARTLAEVIVEQAGRERVCATPCFGNIQGRTGTIASPLPRSRCGTWWCACLPPVPCLLPTTRISSSSPCATDA